jgi:hypothetical protein
MRLRFSALYDRIISYHLLFQPKNVCDGSSGGSARPESPGSRSGPADFGIAWTLFLSILFSGCIINIEEPCSHIDRNLVNEIIYSASSVCAWFNYMLCDILVYM